MRDRQTCIDCAKQSPETETNYTLISAQFGWRLSRRRDKNGDFVVEWRCAECWREHKKKMDNDFPSSMNQKAAVERAEVKPRPAVPPTPPKTSSGNASHHSSRPPTASKPTSPSKAPPPLRGAPPSKPPPRSTSTRPSHAPSPDSEPPRSVPPLPRPRRP